GARCWPRRSVLAVVDAPCHDGPVGVALEVLDDDLAADARVPERALAGARERLADAHPARRWLLRQPLFVGIPVEAEPYAADLRARGPPDVDLCALRGRLVDHERRLRADDARCGRHPRRAEARLGGRGAAAPARALERARERLVARGAELDCDHSLLLAT